MYFIAPNYRFQIRIGCDPISDREYLYLFRWDGHKSGCSAVPIRPINGSSQIVKGAASSAIVDTRSCYFYIRFQQFTGWWISRRSTANHSKDLKLVMVLKSVALTSLSEITDIIRKCINRQLVTYINTFDYDN